MAEPTQRLWKLFKHCDLCLGFWVFLLAALVTNIQVYYLPDVFVTIPVVSTVALYILNSFVTAIISTFVVHVFVLGWKAKFYVYTAE